MKRQEMGFLQAMEYILNVLSFSYYVKADSLVSDGVFDALERLYMKLFNEPNAPMRGIEAGELYSNGVRVVYNTIKSKEKHE